MPRRPYQGSDLRLRSLNAQADLARTRMRTLVGSAFGLSVSELSRKARMQLRDRFGRFIEMGGDIEWKDNWADDGKGRGGFLGVDTDGKVLVYDREGGDVTRIDPESVLTVAARARLPEDLDEARAARARVRAPFDLDEADDLSLNRANEIAFEMLQEDNPRVRADIDAQLRREQEQRDQEARWASLPKGSDLPTMGYEPPAFESDLADTAEKIMGEAYKMYQESMKARGGKDRAMPLDEFKRALVARIKGGVGDDLLIKVPSDVWPLIIARGAVMNQFETGTSTALYNPELRTKIEKEKLGVPEKLPAHLRPVYGLMQRDEGDLYGPTSVKMKDHVKDRTTVTLSDTIGTLGLARPTNAVPYRTVGELSDEQVVALAGDRAFLGAKYLAGYGADSDIDYSEVQVHGGAPVDDIEEIIIDDSVERSFESPEGDSPPQWMHQPLGIFTPHPRAGRMDRTEVVSVLQRLGIDPSYVSMMYPSTKVAYEELLDRAYAVINSGGTLEQHPEIVNGFAQALARAGGNNGTKVSLRRRSAGKR